MGSSVNSGQLLLQHKDFNNHYAGAFTELKEAKELLDVTLACEDYSLDAHKVVLSASSPFFRKVLLRTKQNHPFIYLKGIKFCDLEDIIDFLYTGEAQIAAEDINRFLEAAQELEIKGLAKENDQETGANEKDSETTVGNDSEMEEKKEYQEVETLKDCETAGKQSALFQDRKIKIEETDSELEKEITNNLEFIFVEGVKAFRCKICDKVCNKKANASDHIESHLDHFTFTCEFCKKIMKTRTALTKHTIRSHTFQTTLE